MELLQLKYFEAVARYENMTTASRELCVAQPAISQSISRLEEDLGVALFSREGRRIRLNDCGKHLLARVAPMLSSLENVRLELAEIADQTSSSIGLKVLSASSLLPRMLSEFRQIFPRISFRLIQNPLETNFDLCLSSAASVRDSTETVLLDEEILLAVPRDYPCAADGAICLSDLKGADFISLRKGLTFRTIMDDYCQRVRFVPKIVFESDNPSTVRGLISAGVGIAFWPACSWGSPAADKVKALHLSDLNARRVITLSMPEGRSMSKAAAAFSGFAAEFFRTL
jgi:DNA-binding transcriptional LysR family regulator